MNSKVPYKLKLKYIRYNRAVDFAKSQILEILAHGLVELLASLCGHARRTRHRRYKMTEMNKDLLEQFIKINRMMMKYQFMNYRERGPFGNPERGQGRVLSLLKIKPEITQKELAFLLDMRNQSLGELLSKLEKKELITRQTSESDKRAMIVKLTDKGKQAADKIEDKQTDKDQIFGCLSDEEQKNLSEYLSKIIGEMGKNWSGFDEMNMTPEQMADLRKGFGKMHRHFGHGQGHPFGGGPRRGRDKNNDSCEHPYMYDDEDNDKEKNE